MAVDFAATDESDFLSDDDVEELSALTVFPSVFDAAGYDDVDEPGRFKYPYASAGSVHAIAPEDLLELQWATLQETPDAVQPDASDAIPWVPRGEAVVPNFQNQGVVVLNIQVPQGFRWWIDGYAFNLFPSTSNELNYFWQLRIDGMDMLNKGNFVAAPGRPVQSPEKVVIGRAKDQMFLAQPGSVVQVVVMALNTVGASDSVSAAVFGFLEGYP